MPHPPAVALVPGFFGFEHRGSSTYFADRFVAGLRLALEAKGVEGIPVVSVSTMGIASLSKRQGDLLGELEALETATATSPRLGGPRTWHLVGHSTGGVDAAMLLHESPVIEGPEGTVACDGSWGRWSALIERVRSVTTISAPHFGTGLAESPAARLVTKEPSLAGLAAIARGGLDAVNRDELASRVRFALSATPGFVKLPFFMTQMLWMNELARDLRPPVVGPLSSRPVRASVAGNVFSVATVAPRPQADHSDALFRDLWRWTHEGGLRCKPAPRAHPSWNDEALRLPSQRRIALPPIDGGDNDGIVTTQRQALGELIGVVVGDHVDVLGRYRRTSLVDGKMIDPGLLTSGANFGDDEFFALLLRIGARIARCIQES